MQDILLHYSTPKALQSLAQSQTFSMTSKALQSLAHVMTHVVRVNISFKSFNSKTLRRNIRQMGVILHESHLFDVTFFDFFHFNEKFWGKDTRPLNRISR